MAAKEIKIPSSFVIETHVAGVTFKNEDGSDRQEFIKLYVEPGMAADLLPEPENPYDPSAIMVIIYGVQIGHIPRDITSRLNSAISAGALVNATVDWVGDRDIMGVGLRIELSN